MVFKKEKMVSLDFSQGNDEGKRERNCHKEMMTQKKEFEWLSQGNDNRNQGHQRVV